MILPPKFLSTPPSRVATWFFFIYCCFCYVSIHATPAGGDIDIPAAEYEPGGFYPRHPRGWRLGFRFSISSSSLFLSTPPPRVATLQDYLIKR